MTTYSIRTDADSAIKAKSVDLRAMAAQEFIVGTNDGTFSAAECHAAVGTGDSTYGVVTVYESVSGRRRWEGPSEERMPGRMRWFSPRGLQEARAAYRAAVERSKAR